MMQGFACHARGVELPTSAPSRVHARVRSKRVHDVHLRAERGKLVVACSCPARSFGLDVCKHVWAALLEVDRHDGLADLRGSRGPLVVEPVPPVPARPDTGEGTSEAAKASAPRDDGSVPEARATAKTPKAGKDSKVKERPAPLRAAAAASTASPPRTKALAKTTTATTERPAKPNTPKEDRR
jgi:hypothetical protein